MLALQDSSASRQNSAVKARTSSNSAPSTSGSSTATNSIGTSTGACSTKRRKHMPRQLHPLVLCSRLSEQVWLSLAVLAASMGDWPRHQTCLEHCLRMNRNNAHALLLLARHTEMRQHDYQEASDLYGHLLSLFTADIKPSTSSSSMMRNDLPVTVLDDVDQKNRSFPNNPTNSTTEEAKVALQCDVSTARARCLCHLGDLKGAMAALQVGLACLTHATPAGSAEFWAVAGVLYGQCGCDRPAMDALYRARTLLCRPAFQPIQEDRISDRRTDNHRNRRNHRDRSMVDNATLARIHWHLARLFARNGDLTAALACIDYVLAVDIEELRPQSLLVRAIVLWESKTESNRQRAIDDLTMAGEYTEAEALLASLQGDLPALDALLEARPECAVGWHYLARLRTSRGDRMGAFQACLVAIERDASNGSHWALLSAFYAGTQQWPDALEALTRAQQLLPSSHALWANAARIHRRMGSSSEVVAGLCRRASEYGVRLVGEWEENLELLDPFLHLPSHIP